MKLQGTSRPNPYTPGAGDRPRALVGRSDQLALAESVRSQLEAGYSANSLMYVGLRGVGKTVLLKEIADRLARAGWYAPYLELRRGLAVDVALGAVADRFASGLPPGAKLARVVYGSCCGVGVASKYSVVVPASAVAGLRLISTTSQRCSPPSPRQAADGLGVALIVDELQSVSLASLGALVHVAQNLRDRLPFAFIGAGLPHLATYIAKAATYTERFRYQPTDNLHDQEAQAALLEPAAAEGVGWDEALWRRWSAPLLGTRTSSSSTRSKPGMSPGAPAQLRQSSWRMWRRLSPVVQRQIEAGMYWSSFRRHDRDPSGTTCSRCRTSWTPR